MPLWSMNTKEAQALQVEKFSAVVTVEDHLMDGGFGSWLLEAVSRRPDLLLRSVRLRYVPVCRENLQRGLLVRLWNVELPVRFFGLLVCCRDSSRFY